MIIDWIQWIIVIVKVQTNIQYYNKQICGCIIHDKDQDMVNLSDYKEINQKMYKEKKSIIMWNMGMLICDCTY